MGGAWESLIKSAKRSQRFITLETVFTDKAIYTFICETECIINQRPTAISDTLTPNHFLIVEEHPNDPPGEFSSKEVNYPKNGEQFKQLPIFYGTVGKRSYSQH